jgi:hypothetical protein
VALRRAREPLDRHRAALVLRFGRKIVRKPRLGSLEPTVHVAVLRRRISPFVDIDIGVNKEWIDGRRDRRRSIGRRQMRGHCQRK